MDNNIVENLPSEINDKRITAYCTNQENIIPLIKEIFEYNKNKDIFYLKAIDAKEANKNSRWATFLSSIYKRDKRKPIRNMDQFSETIQELSNYAHKCSLNTILFLAYNVHHIDEAFLEKMDRIKKNFLWEHKVSMKLILIGSEKQYSKMLSGISDDRLKKICFRIIKEKMLSN